MGLESGERLSIAELAERAGVTPRTVRFYVAEGLLPAPGGAGQRRVYSDEHLLRLRAIKRLKEAYLPLDEIRRRLAGLERRDLERIATAEGPPRNTALEYVTALLAGQGAALAAERASGPALTTPAPRSAATALAVPDAAQPSLWQRVTLAPGVELHYQPDDDPRRQAAIEEIVRLASRRLASVPPPRSARR